MGINVTVDEKLLQEVAKLKGEQNPEVLVRQVLEDVLAKQRRPIDAMLDLVGKVRLRDDYDHKKLRAGNGDPD